MFVFCTTLRWHKMIRSRQMLHPMKVQIDYSKPAQMAPRLKRSALLLMTEGGSGKSAMCSGSGSQGGCVPLRIGSVNVGSLRGRDGRWWISPRGRAFGLLLSPEDKLEKVKMTRFLILIVRTLSLFLLSRHLVNGPCDSFFCLRRSLNCHFELNWMKKGYGAERSECDSLDRHAWRRKIVDYTCRPRFLSGP